MLNYFATEMVEDEGLFDGCPIKPGTYKHTFGNPGGYLINPDQLWWNLINLG